MRAPSRVALVLAGVSLARPVFAHLMSAQHGTLNLVGDGAYVVLSLPATAFPGADDDHDGRLSRAEFDRHQSEIAAAVLAGVSLQDATGRHPPEGLLLGLSPTDAEPLAPAPDLVALGRIPVAHPDQPATLRITLFGTTPTARTQEVLVTRGTARRVIVLTPDEPARTLFPTPWQTFGDALRRGVRHILGGPDHLLFVGVTLVGGGTWRMIFLALTCFTLGHAVTLALSVLGTVSVPSSIVEPAIAATLVGMALLDGVADARGVRVDTRLRLALVFACALIHGLGFAGALRDLGMQPQDRAPVIAGFNLGIECGQLAVSTVAILAALALGRMLTTSRVLQARQAARGVVLVAGCVWFIARVAGV